jgi:hypothetical protein
MEAMQNRPDPNLKDLTPKVPPQSNSPTLRIYRSLVALPHTIAPSWNRIGSAYIHQALSKLWRPIDSLSATVSRVPLEGF